MRKASTPLGRRLFTVGLTVALVATTLGLAANVASATTATPAKPNPLSDKLQRLIQPDLAPSSPAVANGAPRELTSGPGSITSNAPGRVTVEIRVAALTFAQAAAVKKAGATVTFTDKATRTYLAGIAIADLPTLAAVPGVEYINEVLRPATSVACEQGDKVSEGDTHLKAALARTSKSVTGNGIKVGVLSDSFATRTSPVPTTTAAQDVANGDLPGAANPCTNQQTPMNIVDFTPPTGSSTDEGRGMAQIVHDLAPQAKIDFSTANSNQAQFATNILNLQAAGAKVIVDDITYFAEPMYQDGVIAKAVQDVTDLGTVYYSSAGNNNFNVGGVPVSSYEAQNGYRPMACPAAVAAGHADCHDFDPTAGTADGDTVTWSANTTLRFVMGWNEPAFGVNTDYDLYFLDSGGNVVLSSTNVNTASQTPFEFLNAATGASAFIGKIVVARKSSGAPASNPRFKLVFFGNGAQGFSAVQWSSLNSTDTFGPATYGHNAKINAATVAAVRQDTTTNAEGFTSKGPATYCFGPIVGAVAAAPLAGGCQTKQIDMAATDGGANTFFGSNVGGGTFRFFGTSAAAPHAAAVAALMLEAKPCSTPAQIIAAQKATAHTVGAEGVNTVGSGLIDADLAIGALADCPPTVPAVAPITSNEGDVVTVNFPGAASQPAGHPLTYALAQTSGPTVTYIQTSATTQRKFIAPRTTSAAPMAVTFILTVTDTTLGTSTLVPVNLTVNNISPVAVPSAPKVVTAGSPVILQGASNDQIEPDVTPAGSTGRQYAWTQTGGPGIALTPGGGAAFRTATFTPASAGIYTFQLVVTDHGGTGTASAAVPVTVDVRNAVGAGTLAGIVKDQAGAALSGATVEVYTNKAGAPIASTTTNGSGAWTIGGLSNGTNYFVKFTNAGYATRWDFDGFNTAFVRPVTTPRATVDAVLSNVTRSITGTVVNSASVPVTGVAVQLVDETGVLDSTTTVGGAYSFTGLTAKGTYRVQIAPSDATFAPAWVTSDGRGASTGASGLAILLVSTTSGNAVATTTTVYNKLTELRSLAVTVRTAGLAPITGTEVRVYNPGWVVSQRTNVAGVYTITGLRPANTYQVWVWTKCAGCTSSAFTSQWATGVPGEQYDQSGKLANAVDITSNQVLTFTLS
jgi:hypothetical protein